MGFWNRVKEEIASQKTKQEWLAEKADVSLRTFENWVYRNIIPNAEEAQRIAAALGVTVEYLVTGDTPEGIPPKTLSIARKVAALTLEDQEEVLAMVEYKLARYY